jgi:8-oxo-dGTP pyrophosphatase MutT (NUDIX family)
MIAQAGGIVFDSVEGQPHILLVTAKRAPSHWIFPKGHIEPGETPEETARREVREEAGVDGETIALIGPSEFTADKGRIHVDYYLFKLVRVVETTEGRQIRWCSVQDALNLLTFDDARGLLTQSMPLITAHL